MAEIGYPDPGPAIGEPGFDPHIQPLLMYYPDGSNVTLSLEDFNIAREFAVQSSCVFAAQIGASVIVMVLLAILTRPEKRRTLLFWINQLALTVIVIRSILQIGRFLSPFYDAYNYLLFDWSTIPAGTIASTVAANTIQIAVIAVTQFSLLLQIRVVYASEQKSWKAWGVLGATCAVALADTVMYAISSIQSSIAVVQLVPYGGGWLYPAAKGVYAFSICCTSVVFAFKLWNAIKRRRQLGLQKFGPLQIVFIVACQTMVIPAIFSVIENVVTFDGLSSMSAALVALSLPLSSMWAQAQTDHPDTYIAAGRKASSSSSAASRRAGGRGRDDCESGSHAASEDTAVGETETKAWGKSVAPGVIEVAKEFDVVSSTEEADISDGVQEGEACLSEKGSRDSMSCSSGSAKRTHDSVATHASAGTHMSVGTNTSVGTQPSWAGSGTAVHAMTMMAGIDEVV